MSDRDAGWSALMRAANAGDGRAYARLLHSLTPVLRGIIRNRARDMPPDHHEDILQEVLMAIHAKRHTWNPSEPLSPWLYAVTRYKIIDAFRRRGRSEFLPIEDFADELAADEPIITATRDSAALLARLDPRAAGIVRAIHLQGESHATVSARHGMSEGALRVALHRALARLSQLARGGEGK